MNESPIRVRCSTVRWAPVGPAGELQRWVACLDADPSITGAGPSIRAAIGEMVWRNPDVFGRVVVEGEPPSNVC